jgi:nucleosome binding factor SPN SPT16 subunit
MGYEFPATLIVLTTAVMYIVTTEKKGLTIPLSKVVPAC